MSYFFVSKSFSNLLNKFKKHKIMKTKYLISTTFLLIGFIQNVFSQTYLDSQKQNNEYKSLHDATTRAYATPNTSSNQNSSNSGSTISNTSSSSNNNSGSSVTNYNFNNTERLNLNSYERDQARNQKNHDKQQAIYDSFDAKEKKWRELMEASRLEKTGENFYKFVQMGIQCGLDDYTCSRMLGGSPEGYEQMINPYSTDGSANFSGSTTSDCSGDCIETLNYGNGVATYVGNTKNGAGNGKGQLNYADGMVLSGTFVKGIIKGDVTLKYADGAIYEGGFSNNEQNGWGKYSNKNSSSTGFYKNGKIEKRGQRTIEQASGQIKMINYDDPTKSTIKFTNGADFIGTLDENNNYVNGRVNFGSDHYFIGDIKEGKKVKGFYFNKGISYEGVFYPDGINLKIGTVTNTAGNYKLMGYFNESGKLQGYGKYYDDKGNIVEAANYENNIYGGAVIYTFKNGDVLTGTTKISSYKLYGLVKLSDGQFYMKGLKENGWIDPDSSEKANILKIYADTNALLTQERINFENALK